MAGCLLVCGAVGAVFRGMLRGHTSERGMVCTCKRLRSRAIINHFLYTAFCHRPVHGVFVITHPSYNISLKVTAPSISVLPRTDGWARTPQRLKPRWEKNKNTENFPPSAPAASGSPRRQRAKKSGKSAKKKNNQSQGIAQYLEFREARMGVHGLLLCFGAWDWASPCATGRGDAGGVLGAGVGAVRQVG